MEVWRVTEDGGRMVVGGRGSCLFQGSNGGVESWTLVEQLVRTHEQNRVFAYMRKPAERVLRIFLPPLLIYIYLLVPICESRTIQWKLS